VGVLLRGAEETRFSLVHLVTASMPNLSQLFVREILSPVACDFFVSESRSLEMRLQFHFRQPSRTAARRRVYIFLSSCGFMVAPSRRSRTIESSSTARIMPYDIHVQAIADRILTVSSRLSQEPSALGHLNVSERHLQDHRLSTQALNASSILVGPLNDSAADGRENRARAAADNVTERVPD